MPHLRTICLDQQDVWRDPNRLRAAVHSIWNRDAAQGMRALLATLDPLDTVVHLHSWTKALSTSVVREVRDGGFRLVTTLHDFLTVCPTGTLVPLRHRPLLRADAAVGRLRRVQLRFAELRPQAVARRPADGAVAGRRAAGRRRRTSSPSPRPPTASCASCCRATPLHHVHNFTEVPRHPPVDVDDNGNVVYVGRLSAEKGPLLLADCLQRVGARGVFVGDGELRAAVRARCPSATTTGWLPPDGVRDHLSQARMLVLPSLWFEAQGLVVAEAAAMGVPSIVPDTSGARDWVEDGVDGFWFRGGDADDLARQILRLLREPALAARLGRAAYERFWAAPPTLDQHLVELERIYGDHDSAGGGRA